MPRRGFVPKREVLPDPVYGTTVVSKLINQIMLDGKRGTAQRICYSAFETVAPLTNLGCKIANKKSIIICDKISDFLIFFILTFL